MSQVYSTYAGTKPAEQPAPGDAQEWLSCEVCSLTFKNQQHYSIHCGGTLHANRVAASLRTQQTSTKSSLEDPQGYGSSSNPSYWTGMQQAFSFPGAQQHDSQKSANRSQSGQGQLNTSADAYQSQLEYVSYPVGKQAKQASDGKTTGGYEGLYGMPGFGWSDRQPDSSQQYPATARVAELQQMKSTSSSKPVAQDAWKNYQQQTDASRVQTHKDFGAKKPVDYCYSTQDLSVASYSSQKSDAPSWLQVIEPAVQKTESYKSSNKAALYGSQGPFSSDASTRGTAHEGLWKSTPNYEMDVSGQVRPTKEGSYGKTGQSVRGKTRWDTGDSSSREGRQLSAERPGSETRRREERDSYGRGSYRDGKESSNSRGNEDLYRKPESSQWEDARERDARQKQEFDVTDRREDPWSKEMSYGTKRTVDKREIGSHGDVGKGREDSVGWGSSYTGDVSSARYTHTRDESFSGKAGGNENVQLRNQGFANKPAGKPDVQQLVQTEWKSDSWDSRGDRWQAKAPEASSQVRKSLQGAETLDQKASYDQQHKQSWGGETVQGKANTSWTQAEGSSVWDADYLFPAASGASSWSAEPGYAAAGFSSKDDQNERTATYGRADKNSWSQKEFERNSSGQLRVGNAWPTANSGHGVGRGMQRLSGTSGVQERPGVDDALAKFKQASKEAGQKLGADVGSSLYGDSNQGLSSYTTRPLPAGKSGQRTSDPKSGYDWNWAAGVDDKHQEFGVSYDEQESAADQPDWGGTYSDGRGGYRPPGPSSANRTGQNAAQANQWTAWSDAEQRAGMRGSGAFAKDQQASQTGGLGRGHSGFQDIKGLGRGMGIGRGEVKGIDKPSGLGKSVQKDDRAENQDWARSSNPRVQSLLGKAPGAPSSAENASWFRGQEMSGAGRGGGRGVAGNRPTPQPGEVGSWRQGFQEQGKLPVSAGRGGPMRGSESSVGQRNSWGSGGTSVKPSASPTRGLEKGQESRAPNLQEKMRQFSEQNFTRDWNEKGRDLQESRNPVRASVGAPGQANSSIAAAGQRANQNRSSVPSLLNLNVAPTGKSQKNDGNEDKYSRDAANSKQMSSGVQQLLSSAFSAKKTEQSPVSDRKSGSAMIPPVTTSSRLEFVVPSTGKIVSSGMNKPLSQPAAAGTAAQKALATKQALLPTPSMLSQSQNKQNAPVEAAGKQPMLSQSQNKQNVPVGAATKQPMLSQSQNKQNVPVGAAANQPVLSQSQNKQNTPVVAAIKQPMPLQGQNKQNVSVVAATKQPMLSQNQNKLPVSAANQPVLSQSQNKQNVHVEAAGKQPVPLQGQNKQNAPVGAAAKQSVLVQGQNKQNAPVEAAAKQPMLSQSQNKQNAPVEAATKQPVLSQSQNVPVGAAAKQLVQSQPQNKQNIPVNPMTKTPSGPAVKVSGGSGEFNPLDPASARKLGGIGDNKQTGTSSTVSSQTSVITTGISTAVASKEQAATNNTRSASKLDSKVAPAAATAAADTKIGLKSPDSQLHGSCPSVTRSSSATAAQPVITAKPTPLASSTGNTPRLDSSKKAVAQKTNPVAPRDAKKDEQDNEDECDPALSEALGQFFSEGKDGPAETVKPAIPAKKTANNTKFVPTIRTYTVKSLSGFSGGKTDSGGDNTKKVDASTTKDQPSQKLMPATITIKVEKDDPILSGSGDDQKTVGKAGDPIAELSKLLPPNLMKEITSGHPSKELLVKVADLLPANVLKQAVDYLQGSSATQQPATETKELQLGVSVDVSSKTKADDEKSKLKAADTVKKTEKPGQAPSRVQAIQPKKGLPNPPALGGTIAKGPVTDSSAKTPFDSAGNSKQPGTSVSMAKPPVQGSVVSKQKYSDIDLTKLKNLTFDEMLKLFQELLQDVLGGLFEDGQKPSALSEMRFLDSLSVEDREMALKVRQMTGITDLSKITHTINVLNSLNSETVQALGQLDKSIIASSLTGNEKAQRMGVTVLQQITELMAKSSSDAKRKSTGPQGPVGRGRGSVRPPQPGSSSGRGVQSLLTLNFTETPKLGAASAGLASAARPLLPTPHLAQQPRFSMDSMMASPGMGLLPTPLQQAQMQNFQRPILRKRAPLQSEEFYSFAPPMKRWR